MTEEHVPLPEVDAAEVERIRQALRPLTTARWADDVAAVLRAAGVKGRRMDPRACPLARYISQVTGLSTEVGGFSALLHPHERRMVRVPFTGALVTFRRDFDQGVRFQDLSEGRS